jgi:hypothetical protein
MIHRYTLKSSRSALRKPVKFFNMGVEHWVHRCGAKQLGPMPRNPANRTTPQLNHVLTYDSWEARAYEMVSRICGLRACLAKDREENEGQGGLKARRGLKCGVDI